MESGGHKVAPAPTKVKRVEYKSPPEGGGGVERGGGGTHIAATVKNTVRRLLRRTKSHRDPPSSYAPIMTPTTTANFNGTNTVTTTTTTTTTTTANNTIASRVPRNYDAIQSRRSQPQQTPPPPPSEVQTARVIRSARKNYKRNTCRRRPTIEVRERDDFVFQGEIIKVQHYFKMTMFLEFHCSFLEMKFSI